MDICYQNVDKNSQVRCSVNSVQLKLDYVIIHALKIEIVLFKKTRQYKSFFKYCTRNKISPNSHSHYTMIKRLQTIVIRQRTIIGLIIIN